MGFKDVVEKTPNLKGTWRAGLGALRPEDRRHIRAEDTSMLRGSVDIDKALKKKEPHACRWDFAIAYKHTDLSTEFVYWVEIHPENEVSEVRKKLLWLKEWLKRDGKGLDKDNFPREFIWLSSGSTSTLNDPKRKELAAKLGLQHKGRELHIRKARPG